jgi:hypothetical protein
MSRHLLPKLRYPAASSVECIAPEDQPCAVLVAALSATSILNANHARHCCNGPTHRQGTLVHVWSGVRAAKSLLQMEATVVGMGTLLAVTAILVCCLVADKFRTQRSHNSQMRVNQVGCT